MGTVSSKQCSSPPNPLALPVGPAGGLRRLNWNNKPAQRWQLISPLKAIIELKDNCIVSHSGVFQNCL